MTPISINQIPSHLPSIASVFFSDYEYMISPLLPNDIHKALNGANVFLLGGVVSSETEETMLNGAFISYLSKIYKSILIFVETIPSLEEVTDDEQRAEILERFQIDFNPNIFIAGWDFEGPKAEELSTAYDVNLELLSEMERVSRKIQIARENRDAIQPDDEGNFTRRQLKQIANEEKRISKGLEAELRLQQEFTTSNNHVGELVVETFPARMEAMASTLANIPEESDPDTAYVFLAGAAQLRPISEQFNADPLYEEVDRHKAVILIPHTLRMPGEVNED